MILVLDFETSTQWDEEGNKDSSPFHPCNYLVSAGYCFVIDGNLGDVTYDYFQHDHYDGAGVLAARDRLQAALDQTTLLVAHNAKFELMWLRAAGFKYDGPVWCTQISEYILARGRPDVELNLAATCVRRRVSQKKSELIEELFHKKGIPFNAMPMDVVTEYGIADVISCGEVYLDQLLDFAKPSGRSLGPTVTMMNEFCVVLSDMENNGIGIDRTALAELKLEYEIEQAALTTELQDIVGEVMGDTPVNLKSPAQLSQLIYSRRVTDKAAWVETFNLGKDARGKPLRRPRMSRQEFIGNVNRLTERLRKTKAQQCGSCRGTGKETKYTKSGELYKKLPGCKDCDGLGIIYTPLQPHAGLRQHPTDVNDISDGGFGTDKETLNLLAERVQFDKAAPLATKRFLNGIVRLNAIKTYLSSFIGGIERNVRADGLLHCSFNQTITKTARLSSSDPNFQNQPRGGTFPIRRAIVSRFPGGSILEGDEAQLEFRVAGELSGDLQIAEDIANKADVHAFTASILNSVSLAAVTKDQRQGAKADTFKPLYGGSRGSPEQEAYYKAFAEKYSGVTEWHGRLLTEACTYKTITIPSGRQYAFPNARRQHWGGVTGATQIKNYPVQGFATGDIVPCVVIMIWKEMKAANLKSVLINTVHDSVVADCYPGEEMQVAKIMYRCLIDVKYDLKRRYDYDMKLDLDAELKIGPNWLDTKTIPNTELMAA